MWLMSAPIRCLLLLAMPSVIWGREPRVVLAQPIEIAQKVRNKDVDLRLTDGTRVWGRVTAIDEAGITVKARRQAAQTFGWSTVRGVRRGHTTAKASIAMTIGSFVWVGLIASSAPARTEPRHWAPVYLLAGAVPVYLLGRDIEYRPR